MYDAARAAKISRRRRQHHSVQHRDTGSERAHACGERRGSATYAAATHDSVCSATHARRVAAPDEPDRLVSSPDDLHPSPDGYRLMAAALDPAIKQALATRRALVAVLARRILRDGIDGPGRCRYELRPCKLWKQRSHGAAALAARVVRMPLPPPQPQPTFKAGTQVVSLFATVADAQKRLVPDLTQRRLRGLRQREAAAARLFRERDPADHRRRHARHQRQHDADRSICCSQAAEQFLLRLLPEDKGRVGAFNDKIQFSARFTQQSRRAGHRRQGSRLRQRDEAVGCGRRRASTS